MTFCYHPLLFPNFIFLDSFFRFVNLTILLDRFYRFCKASKSAMISSGTISFHFPSPALMLSRTFVALKSG